MRIAATLIIRLYYKNKCSVKSIFEIGRKNVISFTKDERKVRKCFRAAETAKLCKLSFGA